MIWLTLMRVPSSVRIVALACLFVATTLPTGTSLAEPSTATLVRQLKSKDAGKRTQAALMLSRHKANGVRRALEAALDDPVAKVRAAAAAALGRLGDPLALPQLLPLLKDESAAVRRQVQSAVAALEQASSAAQVEIEVGQVRSARQVHSQGLERYIQSAAKDTLRRLPYVKLSEREPSLLIEGQLMRLDGKRRSDAYAVSATVEFVITKMPHRLIHGRVSGKATAYGDVDTDKRPRALSELRRQAVEAATHSALASAEAALRPED